MLDMLKVIAVTAVVLGVFFAGLFWLARRLIPRRSGLQGDAGGGDGGDGGWWGTDDDCGDDGGDGGDGD